MTDTKQTRQLVRYSQGSETGLGIIQADQINPITEFTSMVDLIAAGPLALDQTIANAMSNRQSISLSTVQLLAPIDKFQRDILCTGWNYHAHFTESIGKREGQEVERPKAPTFFTKAPNVVIGPNDYISHDAKISSKWDYEAEIALIIGKQGCSIPQSIAHEYIFGYCLANDVSQRDLQRRHGGQWLKGKSIDKTMPLGPYITLAADVNIADIRLQCVLNGETVQDATASQMAFTVAELVAELSLGMTLYPGDILLTGTPSGIGNAREPQLFLHAGDELITRGGVLGELHNKLVKTDLYQQSSVQLNQ